MKKSLLLLALCVFFFSTDAFSQTRTKAKAKEEVKESQQIAADHERGQDHHDHKDGKGFYIAPKIGFFMPALNEVMSTNYDVTTISETGEWSDFTATNDYTTLGAGLSAGAAFGYMFNSNFGIELGLHYFRTREVERDVVKLPGFSDVSNVYSKQYRSTITFVARGNGDVITPHVRFGILAPLGGEVVLERKVHDEINRAGLLPIPINGLVADIDATAITNGRPTIGFNGAVGLSANLSDRIAIYGEVALESLTVTTDKTEITDFALSASILGNPVQDLPAPGVGTLNIEYVDELNESSNWDTNPLTGESNPNFDDSKPANELAIKGNYNAVGLNVGVRINF